MDNQARSHYAELGTLGSGYSEQGPFHCEDCVHKPASDAPYCNHVVVVADPELQDRREGDLVKINLKKGCCRYVKPPSVIALVLRHGDTVLNDEGKLRSRLDVDIDDEGQKQAADVAKFILANFPNIKRIITTPLKRTQQTVAPIAQALGLQPEIDASIQTWHMGQLIGQKKDDVKPLLDAYIQNPDQPIPGGESLNEVLQRAMPSLTSYLEQAEQDPITLICMTSSVIVPLIKIIAGEPLDVPGDEVGVGPGGLLAISLEGDGYKMEPIFGELKPAEVGAS